MANISQPAPGTPDSPTDQVELVHVSSDTTPAGDHTQAYVFSDGSRKHYVNGVLTDDVKVLDDLAKATVLPTPAEANLSPANVNEIQALHPDVDPADLFVGGASGVAPVEEPVEEETPDPNAPPAEPTDEQTKLDEQAEQNAEDAREDVSVEDNQPEHPVGASAPEAQVISEAPVAASSFPTEGTADVASLGPADDAVAEQKAADADGDDDQGSESLVEDVKEEAEKLWKSVKDFEFKTVEELKAFAAEHGINLHGATKKDDIVEAIKQEDKHDA